MPAGWRFDNSYARLPSLFFSRLKPEPCPLPALVILNEALAAELGLDAQALRCGRSAVFAGNACAGRRTFGPGVRTSSATSPCSATGGRFCSANTWLRTDGASISILKVPAGPVLRGGDGRAVLGPMLREYIISEAMHGLASRRPAALPW